MAAMLTEFRSDLIDLIEQTFAPDPPVDPDDPLPEPLFAEVHDGRLPRLMGFDGNYAGVSPETQTPAPGQGLDQQTSVLVQFYLKYDKDKPINPKKVLSSAPVEEAVERFQRAVQDEIGAGTSGSRWFYDITAIAYPPDPTGQKTRAEITLTAHGNNPALIETVP